MFPITDSSQTIIDCLLSECRKSGVVLSPDTEVQSIEKDESAGYSLNLNRDRTERCNRLLIAPGGLKSANLRNALKDLGHSIEPPVPSLFTFHIEVPWLRALAGVTVPEARVSVDGLKLRQSGPMLVTHWGLSGPAILKLSAWGARELNDRQYRFNVLVDWLPPFGEAGLKGEFATRRKTHPAKQIANVPLSPLPSRLWEALVEASGISPKIRWAELSGAGQHQLIQQLKRSVFPVSGKSMNKEEFVTCGGIRLSEVNFKTMESRVVPGLFFAGEALDIDGVTGGFNFQAAWTTGWIAGRSMGQT